MACQVGLVLSEALLLVLCLHFAGVGVLDAVVLTILGLDTGPWEASAVAGMVVFRVCWMLVPLALGGLEVL